MIRPREQEGEKVREGFKRKLTKKVVDGGGREVGGVEEE